MTETILSVLRDSSIPAADRVWKATRPGVLDPVVLRQWLGRLVRRTLGRHATSDPRSLAVLPYLDAGVAVPEEVQKGAKDAAVRNAGLTAAYAADTAAHVVDCAGYAAEATAEYTAFAGPEEREQQVADLIELLEGGA